MKRSKHNLSHYKLLTCNQGELVPCGLVEVLPGDTFQHSTSLLIRTAPLDRPVMHPVHATVHHWFVPSRLLWVDWEKFITGGPTNQFGDPLPVLDNVTVTEGSLLDYLGVPPGVTYDINALPVRAYNLIFNQNYRDEQLVTELVNSTAGGLDTTSNRTLQYRAWEKDYFTTCTPEPQLGSAVSVPIQGSAPVLGIGKINGNFPGTSTSVRESDNTTSVYANSAEINPAAADYQWAVLGDAATGAFPQIRADASNATASMGIDINDLRYSSALQLFAENRSRFGSRYTEYLRYLGVRPSDGRLQRPEYLGGGKQTVQFSEVLQTAPAFVPSDDEQDGYVGSLAGHGIGAMRSRKYRRFFEEHGYVISLLSVLPRTMYAESLSRLWTRRTNMDFYQKELQSVGQQEVYNSEVDGTHSDPTGRFGWQDRYDDYRRIESSIAGSFRSTDDNWHMGRVFSSDPALNSSFVTANPTNRIYSATTVPQLYVMASHNLIARRLVPKMSKPRLM